MAKILVIEDDITFLGLLRVHLSNLGHEVETAEDAVVGLRSVIEGAPDVILLDIYVPYLEGFELLQTLRGDPATSDIPVIVLTGRGDDETYAKARALGVAGYFTKPVESDKLIKAIEAQIALRKARPREQLS